MVRVSKSDLAKGLERLKLCLRDHGIDPQDLAIEDWSPGDAYGTRYKLTIKEGSVNVTGLFLGAKSFDKFLTQTSMLLTRL